jgi:hypothetical protein
MLLIVSMEIKRSNHRATNWRLARASLKGMRDGKNQHVSRNGRKGRKDICFRKTFASFALFA